MLNKKVLIKIFQKLLVEAKNSYNEFNEADGKIGDGDLGITILNGFEEINNNINKLSKNKTLEANKELIINNAALAGRLAANFNQN